MMKLFIGIAVLFGLSNLGMSVDSFNQYQDTLLGLGLALVLSPWVARQLG